MKPWKLFMLLSVFSAATQAEINERNHPDPGAQAKINRIIAQANSASRPMTDNVAVFQGTQPQFGQGINLGLNVGTVSPSKLGQGPREVNVVTGDNIVVCLHCRSR